MTNHMQILKGLARGNFHHADGIRALYLGPMDEMFIADLKANVSNIMEHRQPSIVREGEHTTGWTKPRGRVEQWSLYNNHGRTDDTSNDFEYRVEDKRVINNPPSPSIAALCKLPSVVNMRLNIIHPGSSLSPHEEHITRRVGHNQVSMRARFHIPLWTNPGCKMLADGNLYHFEEGNLYLFNNGCVHGAINDGDSARAHLVFDLLMTQAAMDIMFRDLDLRHAMYITDNWHKVGEEEITEWAPSKGMTEKQYNSRKLVVHP